MELGFRANAGPLSQISIHIFNIETAVQLAVGAHGWWTAKARAQSLQHVLSSRNASLTAVSTFNLRTYKEERSGYPSYGAARQPGGRFISTILPKASTSEDQDAGLCCLRAVTTALLCLLDEETTGAILVAVLPKFFLNYEQEDVILEEDGPLHPAIAHFVEAVGREESISTAKESLLRKFDSQSQHVSRASRADLQAGESLDVKEVESLLAWISVPFSKRSHQVYPTRSLLVWDIAYVLAQLGFDIEVSTTAITNKDQYNVLVENYNPSPDPIVYFVTASVGPTDTQHVSRHEVHIAPRYRYIPIHAIPAVELRKHFREDRIQTKRVSSMWNATFDHVQDYLKKLPHIREMMGLPELPSTATATTTALPGTSNGDTKPRPLSKYQRSGILERSRF